MRSNIDSLSAMINQADAMLNKAKRAGVEIPSEESLYISDAKDALVHAKTLIHTFSLEKLEEKTKKGFEEANMARSVGQNALKEVSQRRRLLVIMVLLVLIVAGFLILYIRDHDKAKMQN